MNPTFFEQHNVTMKAPPSMPHPDDAEEGQTACYDVHACFTNYPDGTPITVTCWQPTPEERAMIAAGAPCWLIIVGHGMPPVTIQAADPFATPPSDE